MARLEITVFDDVQVADSLKKAIRIVLEAFKKWFNSDDDTPFRLSVKKLEDRGPPALEIKVQEEVITKSAFGK